MRRAGPRSPSLLAPLLALLLCGLACRGSSPYHVQHSVPESLSASAVVVYPFSFRWEAPAWRTFEVSQRLIDVALSESGERALFFGPSEFKVYRPADDNAWAASNAVTLLAPYGVRPDAALVLRTWAERRVQSGQRELLDAKGQTVGQSSVEETAYLGHVEVLHPSTQRVVLALSGEVTVDPFAPRTDDGADPTPELTRLMEDLVRAALKTLAPQLRPPREPSPHLATVALVPWGAFEYAEEGRPAHALTVASLDALDAELLRQGRLRFANPRLDTAVLDRMARLPAGLYVVASPPGAKLAAGDTVLAVEGAPALPQVLARARLAPTPVEARVRRASGELAPVLLP